MTRVLVINKNFVKSIYLFYQQICIMLLKKTTFDNIVCLYTCLDSFSCPMLLNCFTTYYEQKLQNFTILDLAAD